MATNNIGRISALPFDQQNSSSYAIDFGMSPKTNEDLAAYNLPVSYSSENGTSGLIKVNGQYLYNVPGTNTYNVYDEQGGFKGSFESDNSMGDAFKNFAMAVPAFVAGGLGANYLLTGSMLPDAAAAVGGGLLDTAGFEGLTYADVFPELAGTAEGATAIGAAGGAAAAGGGTGLTSGGSALTTGLTNAGTTAGTAAGTAAATGAAGLTLSDAAKVAVPLVTGAAAAAASGKTDGGTQTNTKEPWSEAQPWLKNLLAQGQELQNYYTANPFNDTQKAAYQNLLGDLNTYRAQQMPGLMGLSNNIMGRTYSRGGVTQAPTTAPNYAGNLFGTIKWPGA